MPRVATFSGGGGHIKLLECGILILQATSSLIGDGINSEGGVCLAHEGMTHAICDMMPSRGVGIPFWGRLFTGGIQHAFRGVMFVFLGERHDIPWKVQRATVYLLRAAYDDLMRS